MRPFFAAFSLTTILCFSSLLSAQTFTDPADWAEEICGTIINDDLGDLVDGVLPDPRGFENLGLQTRLWGTLTSNSGTFQGGDISLQTGAEASDYLISASDPDFLIFTPDLAGDKLEGLCFEYRGNPVITIFNGTDVVDTIQAPPKFEVSTICWLNTDLEDVTRVEVTTPLLTEIMGTGSRNIPSSIDSVDFAFGNGCAPPADTCRSQLEDLILDLSSIESTGNHCDEQLINCALWYLNCATHDSLWSDEDHLESCNFFYYTNKATKYLSWVSDNAEVNQVLEDIQAVLSCVVENEITAASDADGDTNGLEWAEYYQECADYNQSIGNYRRASRFRKYAFASAYWTY